MMEVAAWIRSDIEGIQVLETLLPRKQRDMQEEGEQTLPKVSETVRRRGRFPSSSSSDPGYSEVELDALPNCWGYGLMVVGHSLGAGVASILSLMLKPKYPELRCIAFSPPGCIFDYKLAEKSSEWITSVFVGKDMIVRASWHSLIKMRGQVLDMIRRAKANKNTILSSSIKDHSVEDLLYGEDSVPQTPYHAALKQRIEKLSSQTKMHMEHVRMYPPGKLLHLAKTDRSGSTGGIGACCCRYATCGFCQQKDNFYVPMWVEDRQMLDEFLVSSSMLLDHFPDVVNEAILKVNHDFNLN